MAMAMREPSLKNTLRRRTPVPQSTADALTVDVGAALYHRQGVSRSGGQRAVDAAPEVPADGDRLADDLPHVLERVDARPAVVGPLDADLGDREAGAAGEREGFEVGSPAAQSAPPQQRPGGPRRGSPLTPPGVRRTRH